MNAFKTVQEQAKYRVNLKRQLRLRGVAVDVMLSTEELEKLVVAHNADDEMTFDKNSPCGLAGKTVKVVKYATTYQNVSTNPWGCESIDTWESITYIYGGMHYGEEFFLK